MKEQWLSIESVAGLQGVTTRAVRMALGKYITRQVPAKGGRGGMTSEILLTSLPDHNQKEWVLQNMPDLPTIELVQEDSEAIRLTYERSTTRAKAHFDFWSLVLQRSEGVVGNTAMERWVKHWNKSHPDQVTSSKSIYRMRKVVAEPCGRLNLLPSFGIPQSTVRDDWFDIFRTTFLTQHKRSAALCHMIALGKAREAGEDIAEDDFPSVHAFMRRLRAEVAPDMIYAGRHGLKAFEDRHGIHMERDYSDLPAGSCWVGDTRTWDVFVRVPDKATPSTCYITLFLDMRTYLPMGYTCHVGAPSTDNTLRAIRNGVEAYGLPDDLYVDNGKEYRNKDFSGQMRGHLICQDTQRAESLAARMGFRMHFAVVKNARAKIIERQFLDIKNGFDKLFNSFKGGNVREKPEQIKQVLKGGAYPTFEEFKGMVDSYLQEIFPGLACNGKHHNGKSRADLWNDLIAQRAPMRQVSRETASMLTTRTVTGRIQHRGFRITELDCWYWAEWMPVHKGRDIVLRYDPEDLRTAWAYAADGTLIGETTLVQATGALVAPEDKVGKAMVAEGQARKTRERKLLRELLPDATKDQAADLLSAMRSAVGPLTVDRPGGPIQATTHDRDAAELTNESKRGRVEHPIPQQKTNTTRLACWSDEAPLAKQA